MKDVKVRKVYLYKDVLVGFVHSNVFWENVVNGFTNKVYYDIIGMLYTILTIE